MLVYAGILSTIIPRRSIHPMQPRPPRDILLQQFAERFLEDGNVYDPRNRSKFTADEKEALKAKHPFLTNNQLYDFTKNAYAEHPSELAFRKYIGVPVRI